MMYAYSADWLNAGRTFFQKCAHANSKHVTQHHTAVELQNEHS